MAFTAPPGANRTPGNPNWSSTPYSGNTQKRPELTGTINTPSQGSGPCPDGSGGTPVTPGGAGKAPTCPPGSTKKGMVCCAASGMAGVGAGSIGMPTGPGWTPSSVERPNITPIDPKAEYDPEMAKSLANMRGHEEGLKSGAGWAMDTLTGRQADQLEAQVAQARQQAQQMGIPFNEASMRATLMRGVNSAMADEKLGREKMYGEQLSETGRMSGAQAGERNQRLEQDYKTQLSNNELLLDRYGRDIQKYGVDAQAATSANNALMAFYSQLMSGMFNMMGNMSANTTNYYT